MPDNELFSCHGSKVLAEYLPADDLLRHFEDEIACEWSTENSNKIRKCRARQKALRDEIKRRIN